MRRQAADFKAARETQGESAQSRKSYYDSRIKPAHDFKVGDQVDYFCPRKRRGMSQKWQNLFTGPYTVLKVIDRYNYMITRGPTAKPMVVHRDKLKIYFSNPAAPISGLDNPKFAAPLSGLDTTADRRLTTH